MLILLAFFVILILFVNDLFEGLFLSISFGVYIDNTTEFKTSILDKLLIASAVPLTLVLVGKFLSLLTTGSDFDPDNTCLGMRDVGC
tara:strand:+ start:207 stop:467 length:261 start_codon:yes stop_codon:yes gene_type:complete